MKYFIGMDGGGTKTKCILADEELNIIHQCAGGASTFLLLGTEIVSATILSLVNECLEKSGKSPDEISGILIGTSGAGRRSDAEILEKGFQEYLAENNINYKNFRVESDARTALEGAFGGKPGSILIAGTGSIMFGKDESGEIYRVGGFGRFIGDEGSGYMLGRKALMAVAKHYDGRGEETLVTKMLEEKFGINDPPALITEIYTKKFDIASCAPLVIQAAADGDNIASGIVESEVNEILLHIKAMQKKIGNSLRLSFIGGIATTDNYFAETLHGKIKAEMPDVIDMEAEHPPETGAVIMAKNFF